MKTLVLLIVIALAGAGGWAYYQLQEANAPSERRQASPQADKDQARTSDNETVIDKDKIDDPGTLRAAALEGEAGELGRVRVTSQGEEVTIEILLTPPTADKHAVTLGAGNCDERSDGESEEILGQDSTVEIGQVVAGSMSEQLSVEHAPLIEGEFGLVVHEGPTADSDAYACALVAVVD